jgi:hypothetical protein
MDGRELDCCSLYTCQICGKYLRVFFPFLNSGRKGESRVEGGVLSGVKNGPWNPKNASLCGAGPCITVHFRRKLTDTEGYADTRIGTSRRPTPSPRRR